VVIAAKKALAAGTRRILIVDFDLHHGQGTQRAFYDDPRVLYMSVHRYEEGRFWPHLRESNFDWVGEGEGLGFNVNLPLNVVGCGPTEYLAVFNRLFLPIATEYRPDLVIVSAGKFLCSSLQNVCSKIKCSTGNNNLFSAAVLWIRIRMGPY
jgi:histone deacetylase 6